MLLLLLLMLLLLLLFLLLLLMMMMMMVMMMVMILDCFRLGRVVDKEKIKDEGLAMYLQRPDSDRDVKQAEQKHVEVVVEEPKERGHDEVILE